MHAFVRVHAKIAVFAFLRLSGGFVSIGDTCLRVWLDAALRKCYYIQIRVLMFQMLC